MRKLLHTLANRAEALIAVGLLIAIAVIALTGCAGLGDDLHMAALDTAAVTAPAALEGAANLGMGELQGADADWETYGLGLGALAVSAFVGNLVRRRIARRATERRAEVSEG